ncbi:MAG: hypothetical protein GQ547_02385 [Methylophaga sp.]|nr:hypothetical protein [Methylophaga sp.]
MKTIFLLIMFFTINTVSAHCVDDNASKEQNYINCKASAELGNAYAQYALANLYNSGQGVEQDAEQAVVWYKKAANQNNDLAQYSLGVMYEFGLGGLEIDQQEADKWYKLSAKNGNYFALNKLGLIPPSNVKFEPLKKSSKDIKQDTVQDEPQAIERFLDWLFRVEKIKQTP